MEVLDVAIFISRDASIHKKIRIKKRGQMKKVELEVIVYKVGDVYVCMLYNEVYLYN